MSRADGMQTGDSVKRKRKKESMFMVVVKRLVKNRISMIGLAILLLLIMASVFAPLIAPYSPTEMDFSKVYCLPCKEHIFGCDKLGRDLFTRCLYGGRYSLSLGFCAALVSMLCGIFFGTIVGYAGGEVDMVVMRICDIVAAIPGNLVAVLISTTLGAGLVNTILAMSVGGIPHQIRGVRAMCLKEREMEYLDAAKSINCSKMKIMFKHMLPNIISPFIVSFTMGIGNTIMGAAGLAYIGLGIQPPDPEWGAMLAGAKGQILEYPFLLFFPGLCIAITVLAINMFGDGLRDALDPKLKD